MQRLFKPCSDFGRASEPTEAVAVADPSLDHALKYVLVRDGGDFCRKSSLRPIILLLAEEYAAS